MAGVGGRTIAEAKSNLSYAEVNQWSAYLREHGFISPASAARSMIANLEFFIAQVSWSVFKAAGAKNLSVGDFIHRKKEEEPEQEATINDLMSVLKMSKAKERKKL